MTQWVDLQTTNSSVRDYYWKVGKREHTVSTGAPEVIATTSIEESKVDYTSTSARSFAIAGNEGVSGSALAVDMSGRLGETVAGEGVDHDD